MFKQVISSTQLTSDEANNYFRGTIVGTSYKNDVSFLSTLRALVAPRMKEGDRVNLFFFSSSYSAQRLRAMSATSAVVEICDFVPEIINGSIVIYSFDNHEQDSNYAWMELMKSTFVKVYPDWFRLEKVTDFFRKTFYTLCFINPENKKVIVFADNMDMRKMHYLQCSIFALMPWYFDPEAGVSELEMELIESLRNKDSTAYEDCIEKIAKQYDFRSAKIKRLLDGFEEQYERIALEEARYQITRIDNNINDLNSRIRELLKNRRNSEIQILGLETKIASGDKESELMDYFLHNGNIVLDTVEDDYIQFAVKSYIEYFDEDLARRVIDNNRSYIYPNQRNCENIINKNDMRKLMTAVFISQTIRIKVCAAYRFSMNGNVYGISAYRYGAEFRECTPNPHIDAYSCIGNYSESINELLRRHDYIGAIEQCSASCKSLNFNDSTVMCEFMKRIYGTSDRQPYINVKCFELPDGTVVTATEAIKWLNSQEEIANEQND